MKLNLETILEMWKDDSVISNTSLDEVSRQTPQLHSKYLELRSTAKLQLKRMEMQQKTLLKEKWLYYNGKMTQEQIAEYGWEYDPYSAICS